VSKAAFDFQDLPFLVVLGTSGTMTIFWVYFISDINLTVIQQQSLIMVVIVEVRERHPLEPTFSFSNSKVHPF